MPGCKVDVSRVTHPSATHTLRYAFDLHVLSLSLAFILSQDQTLVCFSCFFRSIKNDDILFFFVSLCCFLYLYIKNTVKPQILKSCVFSSFYNRGIQRKEYQGIIVQLEKLFFYNLYIKNSKYKKKEKEKYIE